MVVFALSIWFSDWAGKLLWSNYAKVINICNNNMNYVNRICLPGISMSTPDDHPDIM